MKRVLVISVVLAVMLLTVPGCGFLLGKLPKVTIEPPAKTASEPASEKTAQAEPTPVPESSTAPEGSTAPETDEPQVIQGKLPTPAGGGSSSGSRVKYVPVGAQRTLTTSDLSGLSKWQLDVLRNEIYAAHGRGFDRSDLQNYFNRQTWYSRDSGYSESRLSSREKRNAAFIADYQKRRGQVSSGSSSGRSSTPRRSSGGGQVLPFSSSRQVTSADLQGLSQWELDIARNEIYARHGRPFKRSDLRSYFRGQGWYSEDSGFSESRMSRLEKRNAEFMRNYSR